MVTVVSRAMRQGVERKKEEKCVDENFTVPATGDGGSDFVQPVRSLLPSRL